MELKLEHFSLTQQLCQQCYIYK